MIYTPFILVITVLVTGSESRKVLVFVLANTVESVESIIKNYERKEKTTHSPLPRGQLCTNSTTTKAGNPGIGSILLSIA